MDKNLKEFVEKECVGKQYDSCINSPCVYASANGCKHPKHPKNVSEITIETCPIAKGGK